MTASVFIVYCSVIWSKISQNLHCRVYLLSIHLSYGNQQTHFDLWWHLLSQFCMLLLGLSHLWRKPDHSFVSLWSLPLLSCTSFCLVHIDLLLSALNFYLILLYSLLTISSFFFVVLREMNCGCLPLHYHTWFLIYHFLWPLAFWKIHLNHFFLHHRYFYHDWLLYCYSNII